MAGTYVSIAIKSLVPHASIGQILTRSLADYEPENFAFLSDEILVLMQKSTPVHVVKTDTNQLSFFAGWELLSEFRRRNIATVQVVIHEKEPDEVGLWAVQNELSKAIYIREDLSSRHEYFYDLLNSSKSHWRKIFATPRPRTTVAALQRLCDLTRGYARKFSKKNQLNNEKANPLTSLLEELKKKDSGNDQ